jgi:putative ABC transport system permease protein
MNAANPQAVILDRVITFDVEKDKYVEYYALQNDTCTVTAQLRRNVDSYNFAGYSDDGNGGENLRYTPVGEEAGGEHDLYLSPDKAKFTRTLTGTVLHEHPYFLDVTGHIVFLYPESVKETVLEGTELPDTLAYLITAPDHKTAFTSLHNALTEHHLSAANLFDSAADRESERSLVLIVKVFSYGFILMISLIAAANVFNSISTNIALRRREFAMLRSIGMTGKSLIGMMHYECLLCGTKALAFGLPVSLLVTWLIYAVLQMGIEEHFHIPWVAAGIAVCSVFIVVFASMLYAMQKVKNENPMDALKNENY